MFVPIVIPANDATITIDKLWQFVLAGIGGGIAIICLVRYVLAKIMGSFYDIEDVLRWLCGITTGMSAIFVGVWSSVLADTTGVAFVVSVVFFVAAFICILLNCGYKLHKVQKSKTKA